MLTQRHTFGRTETALESRLNTLQQQFQTFEQLTAEGNYLAAREVVLLIQNELNELNRFIEQIPLLLSDAQVEIPAQLDNIVEGYRELLEKGMCLTIFQLTKKWRRSAESVRSACAVRNACCR